MHTKKDFYRLMYAKGEIDSYLQWMFHYWHEKEYGITPEFTDCVEINGYSNEGHITLKFDNDDEKVFDIPLKYLFEDDEPDEIVTIIWHSNYYDGPLSGMAWYKGNKVWFECDHEFLECMRVFAIYELSEEEIAEEEYWHNLFRQHVGSNTDYGDLEPVECDKDWDAFYKPYEKRKKRDFTKNKRLAMIDESFFEGKRH